jgi:hypothetical protein
VTARARQRARLVAVLLLSWALWIGALFGVEPAPAGAPARSLANWIGSPELAPLPGPCGCELDGDD